MGCCKRVTELLVPSPRFSRVCALHFGNVMGRRGSVVTSLFKKQIADGGPIAISESEHHPLLHDNPGGGVVQAGALSRAGKIFLLDMGGRSAASTSPGKWSNCRG